MPQGDPKSGEKYLHFKNKLYQIAAVAEHSETGEELVIYQALYGDFRVYARPLSMFISEVDHEKYPEVEQKYRFQLVDSVSGLSAGRESAVSEFAADEQAEGASVMEASYRTAAGKEVTELLMDFYDASSYEEKYKILTAMKDDITDVMIDNMAVALDVVIPEGDLDKRFEALKGCLRTYQKYETNRFR